MKQRRWAFRPVGEMLEIRITPTTNNYYLVTSLAEGAGTLTTTGSGIDGSQAHPYQDTTLRGAIDAATTDGGDDTITFDPSLFIGSPGTISLSTVGDTTAGNSDFGITTNITIVGPSVNNGLTLSNSGVTQRFFYIGTTGSLTLENLTLSGGKSQGGSSGAGGGGAGMGGAIFNQGTLKLVSSTVTGNTAQGGSSNGFAFSNGLYGGGGLGNGGNNQTNGDSPNGGSYSGGAGGFGGGGAKGGTFVSNAGNGGFGGGGGGSAYHGSLGGFGGFGGGGGMGFQTDLNRSGGFGGGAAFDRFPYAGGGGAGMGGAIFNAAGTVTITNSTLAGNSAQGGGGASVSTNQSGNGSGYGGGVFNLNGSVSLLNSTLASNTVLPGTGGAGGSSDGGAVYSLGMDNVFVSGTGAGATIGTAAGATVTTYNSIFANNTGDSADLVNDNSTATGGNNLDTGSSGLTAGISTTVTATELNLATALASNGGPTQTLALGPGSSALNAGLDTTQSPYNLSTDQRGGTYARHGSSAVDIGAYEIQPLTTNAVLEGPDAGSDSAVIVTAGSWNATSNDSWLHTTSSDTDSGLATFTFDANSGAARTGTLTIDGTTLTVTQAGAGYSHASSLPIVGDGTIVPNWTAADAAGNVYFSDSTHGTINKWTVATQTISQLVSGLTNPQGLAVDTQGNVFFDDYSTGAVSEWVAGTNSVMLLASVPANPMGLALNSQGNIYVAIPAGNEIFELNSSGTYFSTPYSNGSAVPVGVAVDAAGVMYIADQGQQAIIAWNPVTQSGSTLVSNLHAPYGVAVDGSGNVYYSVQAAGNAGYVAEWFAATQTVSSVSVGNANGVAVDASGNVFTGIAAASPAPDFLGERPNTYVPTDSFSEAYTAGNDATAAVFPSTEPLTGVYAPTSDASWLTVDTISSGVINFSFSKNTGAARTAHLIVLGNPITVSQAAAPSISFTATTPLNLDTVVTGTAGTAKTFTVSSSKLVSDVTVTPPTGVEVSTDGTAYFSSVTLTESSGTLASTTIYARISAGTPISTISGHIALTSTDAIEQDVSIIGEVIASGTLTVTASNPLALGPVMKGTVSAAKTFTVSGTQLSSGNIVITPPSGVQVSRSATSGFSNSLSITASGTLASTTIYTRIAAGASPGTINGNITVARLGAATKNVAVTGTVTAPDLTVTNTHSGIFHQGEAGDTYTIIVTNSGTASTSGRVTVTDTIPTGLTLTNTTSFGWTISISGNTLTATRSDALGAGRSYPALVLTVTVALTAATSVNSTATVSGGGEFNTANDSATDTTSITPLADLMITKTAPANVLGGTMIAYTITVTNTGPSNAQNVSLTDALPSSVAFSSQIQTSGPAFTLSRSGNTINDTLNTLAAGATSTLVVVVSVNSNLTSGTVINNTATVSTTTTETSIANNSSTTNSTVATSGAFSTIDSNDNTKTDVVVVAGTAGGGSGNTVGGNNIYLQRASDGGVKVVVQLVNSGTVLSSTTYDNLHPTGLITIKTGSTVGHSSSVTIMVGLNLPTGVPIIIFGGAGADSLVNQTSNNSVIVGGSGGGSIQGGSGYNILIGGAGAARIWGGPASVPRNGSVIIGGSTIFDHNAAALITFLHEWSAGGNYPSRIGAMMASGFSSSNMIANSLVDQLFGSTGTDWFWDLSGHDFIKPNPKQKGVVISRL